jgi:hypothetical protein
MAKKPTERPSYGELIQLVSGVLARLDPGSVPELIASTRERSRPVSAPTGPSASLDDSATISEADLPASRGLPAWLVVLTLACVALFVAGLVVYLQRPDGGAAADKPGPATPTGMFMIRHSDGSPWLLVDQKPVSAAAYRQVFADHQQPGGPDDPVVWVSYDQARSFARTRGGRLLRDNEWEAAAAEPGFVASDALVEWVESPEGKRTVRGRGKTAVRPDKEQKDVTFRMARDI